MSWNVEHFKGGGSKKYAVDKLIEHFNPDIFGILEFQAKNEARRIAQEHFTEYDFAFTDSQRAIEILVGWKRNKFDQVIYTQRREFQAGNSNLRPGGLLSFRQKGSNIFDNILFLHTDSGTDPTAYKNRHTMFGKIWKMKSAIESMPIQQGQPRFTVCGDLNTMGRKIPEVKAEKEIETLVKDAQKNGMKVLDKSHNRTWSSSGGTKSNLDHIIASNDLLFQSNPMNFDVPDQYEVAVYGWQQLDGAKKKDFIKNISDHCALYAEVSS